MELAVESFSIFIDQLKGVRTVAIHVTIAIGYAPIAKKKRDLMSSLWSKGDEVPKHVHILHIITYAMVYSY